eukprot:6211493-Pleurochrysis_carterae.AAC.1
MRDPRDANVCTVKAQSFSQLNNNKGPREFAESSAISARNPCVPAIRASPAAPRSTAKITGNR